MMDIVTLEVIGDVLRTICALSHVCARNLAGKIISLAKNWRSEEV